MELYNKYVNNEITLEEYIESKNYEDYELSSSKCNELIKKIKKEIKSK